MTDHGRAPAGQALVSDGAQLHGLHPTGFDPSRVDFLAAAIQLIVAIEWEAPAIRDGVNVDYRCQILLAHAREARDSLKRHGVDPDNPEGFLDAAE